jgi:hypothetical protein
MAEPQQAKVAVTKGFERTQPVERVQRAPGSRRADVAGGLVFWRFGRLFVASRWTQNKLQSQPKVRMGVAVLTPGAECNLAISRARRRRPAVGAAMKRKTDFCFFWLFWL